MTDLNRSLAEKPDLPEVFTAEDYLEARAFERYVDSIAIQMGLPTDQHGQEHAEDVSEDVGLLKLPESPELTEGIQEMLETIEDTSTRISNNVSSPIKEEAESFDGINARTLFNLKPFNQQLRYLCSRYVVESVERDAYNGVLEANAWSAAVKNVTYLLDELPSLVHSIYENDIPAYSILYEEFDNLRKNNDNPVEVYLGRDGIYAYYGRLAQNAARGDNDPATDSFPMSDAKLILKNDPKYVVYSRGVMASANKDVKLRYITQFVDPKEDIHFYDTGFVGSIPEDIMKILGFSDKEIDKRIHLLNTKNGKRRLHGIPNNWDINTIEDHPKDEYASDGLDGKEEVVKYKAQPASLEEQFQFLVMRDVLLRHFWIREYIQISKELAETGINS